MNTIISHAAATAAMKQTAMKPKNRKTPRPWRSAKEMEGALDRRELDHAIRLGKEAAEEGKLRLDLALRFLPLVAVERTDDYDAWARRWLSRYLAERNPSMDTAADVAGMLADSKQEPSSIEAILKLL